MYDGQMELAGLGADAWQAMDLDRFDYVLILFHDDKGLKEKVRAAFLEKVMGRNVAEGQCHMEAFKDQGTSGETGDNEWGSSTTGDLAGSERKWMILEGKDAQEILALYSLYAFTDKLIIGSFDLPHGRKLRNLLDSGVATEDELINDVILEMLDHRDRRDHGDQGNGSGA